MVIHPNSDMTSSTAHTRNKASNSASNAANTQEKVTHQTQNTNNDDVTLSQQAHIFERLESKIHSSSGTDEAKVTEIKQRIADGTYEINSARIAQAMLKQDNLLS